MVNSEIDAELDDLLDDFTITENQPSKKVDVTETIEKLRQSDSQIKSEPEQLPDLESMLNEFKGLMGDQNMDQLFEGMFSDLVSRDLLYGPMKDLAVKYPEYFIKNKETLTLVDLNRYKKQYEIVVKIVNVYESKEGDPTEEESKMIADLLQEMQEHGNPPEELVPEAEVPEVGDLEGLTREQKEMMENCNVQ